MNWSEMHSLTIIYAEHVNLIKLIQQSVLKLTFYQLSTTLPGCPFLTDDNYLYEPVPSYIISSSYILCNTLKYLKINFNFYFI